MFFINFVNVEWSMFEVSNIVGLFFNFCFCVVWLSVVCKCFVKLGLIFVDFLFDVCIVWCNICFSLGMSVIIGNLGFILLIFWIIKCFNEIWIVVVNMLGFWFLFEYLVNVWIMVLIFLIGIVLLSKFCSIFMMVLSGSWLGIKFFINFGVDCLSILMRFCIFLWLISCEVLFVRSWLRCVVRMVEELIMV